jgi:hypothetical protein
MSYGYYLVSVHIFIIPHCVGGKVKHHFKTLIKYYELES